MKGEALRLASTFNVPCFSFKASRGWISTFLRCKKFSFCPEPLPKPSKAYKEKLLVFQRFVIKP